MNKLRNAGITAIAAIFAAVLLAACETTTHAEEGQVIGAVLGGLVGSQIGDGRGRTTAIIVGAVAGSMIGRHIGQQMDDNDRRRTALALHEAKTGEVTTWVNPDTGAAYRVTPVRTYQSSAGPCREFKLDATVAGRTDQDLFGTACLRSDGAWVVQ